MLDALATGLREVRKKAIVGSKLQLDGFLEVRRLRWARACMRSRSPTCVTPPLRAQNMLRSRLSRRVLAEQHINLTTTRPGFVGVIALDLGLADAVDFATQRCKQVCMEHYGLAPDVVLTGDKDATLSHIPGERAPPQLVALLQPCLRHAPCC